MLGLNSLFEMPEEGTIIISLPMMNCGGRFNAYPSSPPSGFESGLVSCVNISGAVLLGVISTADSLIATTDFVLFFGLLTEDGIKAIASFALGLSFAFFERSFLMKLFSRIENFSGIVSNSLCCMFVPN